MRYTDADAICHSYIVGDCVRGDRKGEREILLIGDSHDAPFEHGVSLSSDTHHLNEIGARRYGQVAVPHLEQWLTTAVHTH